MEAALLEFLATAARAGIVSPDTLERINRRLGRVGKGQTGIPWTGGSPLLIPLGRIREAVPARKFANGILKRLEPVILETRHALGIRQGPGKIRAKVIVVHHHRFDQTAPEGLTNNAGEGLQAEQRYGQHPAAPDKALLLRLQRVVEPEQVGFRLVSRDPSGGRQIGENLQGTGTDELIRIRGLDQPFEGVEIAIIGADQDPLERGCGAVTQRRLYGLTILREAAQERKHTRVLLLARKVEDEEDRTCGLIRSVGSAGVALHHAE